MTSRISIAALVSLPLILVAPLPALADGVPPPPNERFEAVVVYGEDACPPSPDGAIVVCARKPESERYRIPKALRAQQKVVIGSQGWASQVQSLEAAGRVLLPDSCSSIGSNGFTGCTLNRLHQWYEERQLDRQQNPAP